MVSESLTLITSSSSFRLGDVIFLGMECVGVKRFLRFSRRRQRGSARKFFSGFTRNHLTLQLTLKSSALGL